MRWSRMSVTLAGAVLACQAPELSLRQRAVEEQFVRDRLTQWATATNNREVDSLKAMYRDSPDISVVWASGFMAVGSEAQAQAIDDFYLNVDQLNFVPQSPDVEVLSARVAVVRFRHSMDLRFLDTRRELSSGHGTMVWLKDEADDVWRIHRLHLSVTSGP